MSDPADDRSAAAIERWWAGLKEVDRHAAEGVVRGGGFLTLEMSRSLVREGIPVLMPDDVRVYVKQQLLGRTPPPHPAAGRDPARQLPTRRPGS